jgi:enoyl-CoA hydratase/carnithine racemase
LQWRTESRDTCPRTAIYREKETVMSFALYERHGAVGVVTLNRPERLNAISGSLMADLEGALKRAFADEDANAIVLTGAGRAFCSGDDLKEFDLQTESEEAVRNHVEAIQRITRLTLGSDKPVVGAIHGYAVGGGFEWLLNCDLVVAANNLVAFFPEMSWGHFVTGGVTHILPQAVGYQKAMELFLLGERHSAEQLQNLRLANFVVPVDGMMEKAMSVAKIIASRSRFAVAKLKAALNQQLGDSLWKAVNHEERVTIEAFTHPETIERVKAFSRAEK